MNNKVIMPNTVCKLTTDWIRAAKVFDLKIELRNRNLKVGGNRIELIERLESDLEKSGNGVCGGSVVIPRVLDVDERVRECKTIWNSLKASGDINQKQPLKVIQYILKEFGTSAQCNRFDVGNAIEYKIADILRSAGCIVENFPNERRIDLKVNDHGLSIKYSGDDSYSIKLHNSNNCANTDVKMVDTLVLTPKHIYLISVDELKNQGIDVSKYITNSNDGAQLKSSLLTLLRNSKYQYIMDIKLDKKDCKNRLCAEAFLAGVEKEMENIETEKTDSVNCDIQSKIASLEQELYELKKQQCSESNR